MPRIRSLKPEHKQHRKVGRLSHVLYRLWVGLLTEADDEGRLVAHTLQLRALIFPYHPEVTSSMVDDGLLTLARQGLIRCYWVGRARFIDFPSWFDHQRVNRVTPSKLPSYQDSRRRKFSESSVSPHGALSESSLGIGSDRRGSDLNGSEGREPPRKRSRADQGADPEPVATGIAGFMRLVREKAEAPGFPPPRGGEAEV